MKVFLSISLWVALAFTSVKAQEFNAKQFANDYFNAWVATQSPNATKQDIENYLVLLADDVGHQHIPYDPDDSRSFDGKQKMREGMTHYLAVHTEYVGSLVNALFGYNVVVIEYDTQAKAIHPQTNEPVTLKYRTLEVLEIENGKVSVIRKYSE